MNIVRVRDDGDILRDPCGVDSIIDICFSCCKPTQFLPRFCGCIWFTIAIASIFKFKTKRKMQDLTNSNTIDDNDDLS